MVYHLHLVTLYRIYVKNIYQEKKDMWLHHHMGVLNQNPRHWYDHVILLLKMCGLTPCTQAPFIFRGTPIPGKAPLYLGLYVDYFIYFSSDIEVEKKFQSQLSELTKVQFMGQVSHFIWIKFLWRRGKDGLLSFRLSKEAFADHLASIDELSNC